MNIQQINRTLGGVLLVSGTCIGAGMLGFPLAMAAGGWQGSLLFFLMTWAVMTFTAFAMLEVTLRFPQEINFSSMARKTLGRGGAALAWLVYVGFFYALMTAYTSGGASIVHELLIQGFGLQITPIETIICFVAFFSVVLWIGTAWVDWCNRFFMIGLVAAYAILVTTAFPHIDSHHLVTGDSHYLWQTLPLLVTAFGFHLLIPSLKSYLNHHLFSLKIALWGGSLLSLSIYIIWQYVIFGILSKETLSAMQAGGQPVTQLTDSLKILLDHPWIFWSIQCFGLFALLSSFIGVSLSIFDFFSDGLHLAKVGLKRLLLVMLTLGIPGVLACLNPTGFLKALNYGGVFASVLLIVFPVVMAWRSRALSHVGGYRVGGGNLSLALALLFGIMVIFLQCLT